ncbi:DUF2059 domain-containing protein [Ruegeria arenilitoris]|uniref:DUF2059 domain-containing protein n=1 Tax=Ruegeria arenilitoris TaxID=1173585 RepID=UPI00147F749E|nr:DUF2059 domain-containing protein [Ruegeria arenilitoris]
MRLTAACLSFLLFAVPAAASDRVERLMQALKIEQVVEILRDEGRVQGQELDETFLGNTGGPVFEAQIEEIYAPERMQQQIAETFESRLTDSQMDRAIVFFESEVGQTIVTLENSARLAFADETIKDMAREAYLDSAQDTSLFLLVDEYIEVNDLIDRNVQSSLSSDYNFFRGLSGETGANPEDILAQLLSEKDSVTEETRTWLYSFLLLAYQPLTEAQMRENIAFSRTDTGRAMNEAFFVGFDLIYDQVYFELGQAVSRALSASDL